MTAESTTARQWSARVYQAGPELDVDASRPMALAALRDMIRSEGYTIDDTTLVSGASQAIIVHEDGSWEPWQGVGEVSGFIVDWVGGGNERLQDEPPIDPTMVLQGDDDDSAPLAVFDVPSHIRAEGGGLRVRHGLAAPQGVTVTVYKADGEKMGYMLATPIDDDVEHVELLAGTHRVHVVADAVVEEPDSSDPEKVADPVPDEEPTGG